MNNEIGFTIGKFIPFHKGHEFLINESIKQTKEFYVVVYDTPEFNIDIETKIKWISNSFPNVKIIKAYNSPKQYGLDRESVDIQMKYLKELIKDIPVTCFFSSEKYGKYVAEYLNIKNIVIDIDRKTFPISGSKIRKDIYLYKEFVNDYVFNYLIDK